MFKKLAAALLATALIAGPAFAAPTAGNGGATTTTTTATTHHAVSKHAKLAKSKKLANHARKHINKHVARGKVHTMKQARHVKPTTTHKSHLAKSHIGKTAKITKS